MFPLVKSTLPEIKVKKMYIHCIYLVNWVERSIINVILLCRLVVPHYIDKSVAPKNLIRQVGWSSLQFKIINVKLSFSREMIDIEYACKSISVVLVLPRIKLLKVFARGKSKDYFFNFGHPLALINTQKVIAPTDTHNCRVPLPHPLGLRMLRSCTQKWWFFEHSLLLGQNLRRGLRQNLKLCRQAFFAMRKNAKPSQARFHDWQSGNRLLS